MNAPTPGLLTAALSGLRFSSEERLYAIQVGDNDSLVVEAFYGRDALSECFEYDVLCLSTDAELELKRLLGIQAQLFRNLADGTRHRISGYINAIAQEEADGGFARYRLKLVPGLWFTTQNRNCRVFQDKPVLEIIGEVLSAYRPIVAWKLTDEVPSFVADLRPRSYCVQYRETDYTFITRLLAEEGLGFYFEAIDDADYADPAEVALHRMVIFADSTQLAEDDSSLHQNGGRGIRYHRAGAQEEQDAIQALDATRVLQNAVTTLASYDYKSKAIVSTELPTHHRYGGEYAPALESYDYAGPYAFANRAEAERYARLHRETLEARNKRFHGLSTVRSFQSGRQFDLAESMLDFFEESDKRRFTLLSVEHVGFNNLALEGERHPPATLFNQALNPALIEQAQALGYANTFSAIRSFIPWRPRLHDDTGAYLNPKPTAMATQTAIVVGAQGEAQANGADELYMDHLGRIKVRFHWQRGDTPQDQSTCWLRLSQRAAGNRIGVQFIPRIGQEVAVGFLENDIDRPIALSAVYNGRGEGNHDDSLYGYAQDRRIAAQGNETGGNAPPWHGAAPGNDAQRNNAALSGFKTREFGGSGFN